MELSELVEVFVSGELPTVAALDPYWLGATPTAFGNRHNYGAADPYVPRTRNGFDAQLAEVLTGAAMVIVTGPSKVGKTRALFEAVRACAPEARLVAPVPGSLHRIAAHPQIAESDVPIVVWLDDLDRFLTHLDSFTPAALTRLVTRPGRTIVVATLRSEARDRLRNNEGELTRDTRMLLSQAVTISLASTSEDPAEQAAAAAAYPGQAFGTHGLAEMLASAPELLTRYDDARHADLTLYTVIRTTIDWARVGRLDPIPEQTLIHLTADTLATLHPALDVPEHRIRQAVVAARTSPAGAGRVAALITSFLPDKQRGYRPFDYLLAAEDGQDHAARPIPADFWRKAALDADDEVLMEMGQVAFNRGNASEAIRLIRPLAENDFPTAARNLGGILTQQGELAEAEQWYHRAIDCGDSYAMVNLGSLHLLRNEVTAAEHWYRKAIDTGDIYAMKRLGHLLRDRLEFTEAEHWYHIALNAGDNTILYWLGALFQDKGDPAEAEHWFRKSADIGDTDAMSRVGYLLRERREFTEAEHWYRKALNAGDDGALYWLGALFERKGEPAEAEGWYRKSADTGDTDAMNRVGHLLSNREEFAQAEEWSRKALNAGNDDALFWLGTIFEKRGEPADAEHWFRRAADAGDNAALYWLGTIFEKRGELTDAEHWFRRAADAGHTHAPARLERLLEDRDQPS